MQKTVNYESGLGSVFQNLTKPGVFNKSASGFHNPVNDNNTLVVLFLCVLILKFYNSFMCFDVLYAVNIKQFL